MVQKEIGRLWKEVAGERETAEERYIGREVECFWDLRAGGGLRQSFWRTSKVLIEIKHPTNRRACRPYRTLRRSDRMSAAAASSKSSFRQNIYHFIVFFSA